MKYDVNVKKIREIQKETWNLISSTFHLRKNRDGEVNEDIVAHYGGVFKSGNSQMVMHTDGVGTKVLVAQQLEKYDTVGIDAIAMNANDIICLGAEPLVAVDYIALKEEDEQLTLDLVKGVVKGCEESECALIGGETAILKDIITGHDRPFDLAATMLGKVKKLVTGSTINEGDVIIGLESSGLHSNGYTLARKALDINSWGNEMLKPTKIYVKPIMNLIDDSTISVKGIAHITGGSFTKLTRLTKDYGFLLNNLPEPPEIFKEINKSVNDEKEMYKTLNMGIGMIVIVPEKDEQTALELLNKHNSGNNVDDTNARTIGKIIKEKGVHLHTKGNMLTL